MKLTLGNFLEVSFLKGPLPASVKQEGTDFSAMLSASVKNGPPHKTKAAKDQDASPPDSRPAVSFAIRYSEANKESQVKLKSPAKGAEQAGETDDELPTQADAAAGSGALRSQGMSLSAVAAIAEPSARTVVLPNRQAEKAPILSEAVVEEKSRVQAKFSQTSPERLHNKRAHTEQQAAPTISKPDPVITKPEQAISKPVASGAHEQQKVAVFNHDHSQKRMSAEPAIIHSAKMSPSTRLPEKERVTQSPTQKSEVPSAAHTANTEKTVSRENAPPELVRSQTSLGDVPRRGAQQLPHIASERLSAPNATELEKPAHSARSFPTVAREESHSAIHQKSEVIRSPIVKEVWDGKIMATSPVKPATLPTLAREIRAMEPGRGQAPHSIIQISDTPRGVVEATRPVIQLQVRTLPQSEKTEQAHRDPIRIVLPRNVAALEPRVEGRPAGTSGVDAARSRERVVVQEPVSEPKRERIVSVQIDRSITPLPKNASSANSKQVVETDVLPTGEKALFQPAASKIPSKKTNARVNPEGIKSSGVKADTTLIEPLSRRIVSAETHSLATPTAYRNAYGANHARAVEPSESRQADSITPEPTRSPEAVKKSESAGVVQHAGKAFGPHASKPNERKHVDPKAVPDQMTQRDAAKITESAVSIQPEIVEAAPRALQQPVRFARPQTAPEILTQKIPLMAPFIATPDSRTALPATHSAASGPRESREIRSNSERGENSAARSDQRQPTQSSEVFGDVKRQGGSDSQTQKDEREHNQTGFRSAMGQTHSSAPAAAPDRPLAAAQPAMTESLRVALQQALDMSRKRIVEPNELRLTVQFGEIGTMDIDVVRNADKFSIRLGVDAQALAMMEEQRPQLTQWLSDNGFAVETLDVAPRFSDSSQTDLAGSGHSRADQESASSNGSRRHSGQTGEGLTDDVNAAPRPAFSGARVWTA